MKTEKEIIDYVKEQVTLLESDAELTDQDINIITGRLNSCRWILTNPVYIKAKIKH